MTQDALLRNPAKNLLDTVLYSAACGGSFTFRKGFPFMSLHSCGSSGKYRQVARAQCNKSIAKISLDQWFLTWGQFTRGDKFYLSKG